MKKEFMWTFIGLIAVLTLIVVMDISYQSEVKACVQAVNNIDWCKNELAK